MKKTALLTVLTLAPLVLLSACGKKDAAPGAAASAAAASAAVAASAAAPVVRQATYDPNLKAATIVWDSPEKKKRWEELQAKRAGGVPAPVSPVAPAAPATR